MSPTSRTRDEYSSQERGSRQQKSRSARGGSGRLSGPPRAIAATILLGALAAAAVLVVAEFTDLYTVHVANHSASILSVRTGSHNSYGLIPIAVLAALFGLAVAGVESRPALLAIGLLGIVTLLIALVGDLPDARKSGLVGSPVSHFVQASATPAVGLYLETLGAVLMLVTCGVGFIMIGPPRRRSPRPRPRVAVKPEGSSAKPASSSSRRARSAPRKPKSAS